MKKMLGKHKMCNFSPTYDFFWCEINFQEKQLLECHKVFLNSARKWHLTLRRGGQMTQNWCLFNSSIHYAWMTSNAEYEISKLLWNNFFHEDRISLSVANISKDWVLNISHLVRKLTITYSILGCHQFYWIYFWQLSKVGNTEFSWAFGSKKMGLNLRKSRVDLVCTLQTCCCWLWICVFYA